jgi:hypothetical protein
MDNIEMDHVEIGLGGVALNGMAQDMDKSSSCERGNELRVLQNTGILSSGYTPDGLASSAEVHIVS